MNTALNLYWTEGVSGLSVNDLVRRMGIPKPSLYRHFPSEDKLQASVLLAYEATALSRLRAVSTQAGPFARQMDDYLEILITGIAGHAQGCFLVSKISPCDFW
ncbi:MAG: TetR/AcrR family transcriptional regulator [Pseudomonadota bacterium]|nr:TetR/AcrR family transcriptional regulator [Pseudomonadota bacterium]